MQNPDELLTASELSLRLRMPLQTIYSLTRQGAIPHYRFGRSVRYCPSEVFEAQRNSTPTAAAQRSAPSGRPAGDRPGSRLREAQRRGAAARRGRQMPAVGR